MSQVTITWQPGAVKGRSVAQTSQLIIEACRMWQKVCGVQFATGKFGWPSTITIYPYAGQMNGAMVAYTATRQILYSTTQQFPSDNWTRSAFAHEIGHCFGWGHSANSLPENLMFWRGPSLFYHAAAEAKRARGQFGQPPRKDKPYSIYWLQQEIARFKKLRPVPTAQIKAMEVQLKRVQAEWKAIDGITHVATTVAEPIHECFAKSRTQVASTDWQAVFEELRQQEYA